MDALSLVVWNDDAVFDSVYTSRVAFAAMAGTTYYVQVLGWGEPPWIEEGDITLNWQTLVPPANDDFESATHLTGVEGSVAGDTTGATRESGEPTHTALFPGTTSPADSLWYEWTAHTTR